MIGRGPATADPGPWRLFMALPLPEEAAAAVVERLAAARAEFPGARWIPLPFLHLTLVFLGATDPARRPALVRAIDSAVEREPPFTIETGAGGGRDRADGDGVAWLRLARGGAETSRIGGWLEATVAGQTAGGREPRRSPSAHLTVARRASSELIRYLEEAPPATLRVTWTADRIVLFRSHLERTGARYERLHEAHLHG